MIQWKEFSAGPQIFSSWYMSSTAFPEHNYDNIYQNYTFIFTAEDSSVAKNTSWSSRELGFNSQDLHADSQLSVTPVSWYLMPSSGLLRHQAYTVLVVHGDKTLVHIK